MKEAEESKQSISWGDKYTGLHFKYYPISFEFHAKLRFKRQHQHQLQSGKIHKELKSLDPFFLTYFLVVTESAVLS